MNINASIIDQQLARVAEEIRARACGDLKIKEEEKLKSLAFVYLCAKNRLDLDFEQTFECLTEGGGNFNVDAIHVHQRTGWRIQRDAISGQVQTRFRCQKQIFSKRDTLKALDTSRVANASVLVRIYKLPKDNDDLTHATNSQDPFDLKDLRAYDKVLKALEQNVEALG